MSDTQYDQWKGKSGNVAVEDPHQRMLSKLGKLLEVKNRAATEAEAMTAAALLSRFLTEHNLSMADIEKRGQAAPGVVEGGYDLGKAAFKWKLDLADGIASFYYCTPIIDRHKKTVTFVGRPDNVEALTMLYKWVIDQIKAIATTERRAHFDATQEHIDPLRWQLGFGLGASARLIDRLREMKARQAEDLSRDEWGNVNAIATHHDKEANDYLEAKYGYRNDGKRTKAQQEAHERCEAERVRHSELKVLYEANGDMEPYYAEYPWDRPDTEEEIAAREKRNAEYEKREARNTKRRTGGGGRERQVDERKEEQSYQARQSGKAAAGKINLQPFIGTNVDRKKVG